MSRDKIASRRAFIKKLAGTVAFIAPFMTTITVDALAKSNEGAPETRTCNDNCSYTCSGNCKWTCSACCKEDSCWAVCAVTCKHSCNISCKETNASSCRSVDCFN